MKKISPRVQALIFAGLALMAVLLLAGSMESLDFLPGQSLPFNLVKPDVVNEAIADDGMRSLMSVLRIIFILGWLLLPFYVIYLIISPEARKRLLRDILTIAPFILILYFFLREPTDQGLMEKVETNLEGQLLEEIQTSRVTPPQFNADPPEWMVTVTVVAIAIIATLLVVGIIYLYLRSRAPKAQPLKMVAFEAQAALDAIEAGGDLRDVIIRCYFQMSKAISETRNIKRGPDMTPQEFAVFLQARGLPRDPVQNLTDLFERVRYGGYSPGRSEERVAISSLSAIVASCQKVLR